MAASAPRVAVAGAGIGGLAAAIALTRAGLRADVYEQAPELREVGVGLHLGSNGSRILHRWGLAGRLGAVATRPERMEVRDLGDGRTLAAHPMGAGWAEAFGAPYYTVHRQDLHRLLADQVPAGNLHLNRRLVAFAEDAGGVRLDFAGGGTARADVLVGADGVHSVVRRAIAGPDARVYSGTRAFRGLVPAARLPGLLARTMYVWAGPRTRLLCYPVRGGRSWTFVGVVPAPEPVAESWSARGDPRDFAAAFADGEPRVRELAGAVRDVGLWALYDREPLGRWGTGRVTLLGDAAHPMLPYHGQGASQAVEDAVVLAHCLRTGGPAGLRRYEDVRRPHTARVQLGARGGGSLRLRASGGPDGGLPSLVEDVTWIQRHDVEDHLR